MADAEEPRFTTLAERIAALNQQKNFQTPPPTAGKRPPPPPPPLRAATEAVIRTAAAAAGSAGSSPSLPPRPVRAATERLPPALPRRTTGLAVGGQPSAPPPPGPSLPPPLPARDSPQSTPPKLPTRRPSAQTLPVRRNSNASDVSQLSTISNLSLNQSKPATSNGTPDGHAPRRLPPPLEQAKLPPLPPTRHEREAKAAVEEAAGRTPSLPPRRIADPPPTRPSLPPRLPSRPANSPEVALPQEPSPALPTRRLPPPPASFRQKSALELGFSSGTRKPPPSTSPPSPPSPPSPTPPPVPVGSRPTVAEIDAVATRVPTATHQSVTAVSPPPPPALLPAQSCLVCRDFSGPDTVAAQHPTSSIPRGADPIGHLAAVLCGPFASHTDKARAIFTWMHHNIDYDAHGFLNGCAPRGQTPAETVFSGKAVCEGYARVYEAVAARAGLACVVVTGHGKGYGFSPPQPGAPPPPPNPTGHAWNAVRIDGGVWKLLDACWGAGALGSDGRYVRRFAPECFVASNERFGLRHFPADAAHWYRADGRAVPWDEYVLGPLAGDEPAEWMGDAAREGLDEHNSAPARRKIGVHGHGGGDSVVRFQFAKLCEHWTPERHGPGPQLLFALKVGGPDGRAEDLLPLETDGSWYYLDVRARDLGAPGQRVALVGIQTVDGRSARGMTREEWLRKKGRCGYSYCYLVRWELV